MWITCINMEAMQIIGVDYRDDKLFSFIYLCDIDNRFSPEIF